MFLRALGFDDLKTTAAEAADCQPRAVFLCRRSRGLGIDIGTIPWTETLRAADKADVVRFLNGIRTDNSQRIMPPENVTEFSWVDLAGNGKYVLVMVQMPNVCHVCNSILLICQQSESGRIIMQVLPGTYPLSRAIRDLNGDGKKELIIRPPLDPMVVGDGPVPHVYRLENGKYVEASKDFAGCYDREVLPPIDRAIARLGWLIAHGPIGAKANPRWLRYMHNDVAGLTMERDKIVVRLFGLPCARAFCLIGMRSLHAAFLEKCPAMAHAGVSGRLLRDGDPKPGVKRINAPILGGANCHTWVANRYTALCSWYRREDDPRR